MSKSVGFEYVNTILFKNRYIKYSVNLRNYDMINNNNFILNSEELAHLNDIVAKGAISCANSGNDLGDGISVLFEFSPFGRFVSVKWSGGPYVDISDNVVR